MVSIRARDLRAEMIKLRGKYADAEQVVRKWRAMMMKCGANRPKLAD